MSWESATIVLGGIATIAIFSFLFFGENKLYRFFEHLFIGISAGLYAVQPISQFLWGDILEPMFGLDIVVYPDGTLSKPYNPWLLLYCAPMAIGLLFYFMYSVRHQWLSKIAIGVALGASGGLAFEGFFNEIWPQITGSFKPLIVLTADKAIDWAPSIDNTVFVLILLLVMNYFFFTFKAQAGPLKRLNTSGRWLMMISFGALFGSTVMARMSLLIERLQFMILQWYPTIKGWVLS